MSYCYLASGTSVKIRIVRGFLRVATRSFLSQVPQDTVQEMLCLGNAMSIITYKTGS